MKRLDINEIESYLKTKVPEYMIPSKIIELNEFPMSSNGRIDRKIVYSRGKI
ncbi:MAG: hypothetical protein ACLRHD_00295 [Thomasclavelia spiroformis]